MEFALSEDQRMLRASVHGFLETTAPLDAVRKAAAGDASVPIAISGGLLELGVGQAVIPEANGGLGLGLLDVALIQEALGAAVAPARFMGGVMAAIGLGAVSDEALKAEWLGKLASGEVAFGVAIAERAGSREGAGVAAKDGKLSGRSLFALDTAAATHLLVCDRDGGLHIIEAGAARRTVLQTIDRTRDFAELEFDGAPAIALGEGGAAADRMLSAGRLLIAADTLGAAKTMLEKAVDYAKERKQFNRVIGSFQSVKHLCAEMAAQFEPARALVWHAAYAFDTDDSEAELMICLAKAHLAEVGTFIARTSTEVHGGMGFTDLLGLHYWFKRIGANRQLLGGPELVRAEAAALQGWS